MSLDLNSLQKAVGSLERAVKVAETMSPKKGNADMEEVIRAGVIQNFEFTYELCWKFIQRWLEINSPGQSVDRVTMKELFRLAAERELIMDVEAWFDYHRARNKTSHIYDESIADDVYDATVRFLQDAKKLLQTLEARND